MQQIGRGAPLLSVCVFVFFFGFFFASRSVAIEKRAAKLQVNGEALRGECRIQIFFGLPTEL